MTARHPDDLAPQAVGRDGAMPPGYSVEHRRFGGERVEVSTHVDSARAFMHE